ncbi:MAG: DIP1984 family protein [Bacillota bacterium]
MKLAEALLERKDLLKRLGVLKERLVADARVQEGDRPAQDPEELLSEAEDLCRRLKDLIMAINRANSRVCLSDGRTLTEAIVVGSAWPGWSWGSGGFGLRRCGGCRRVFRLRRGARGCG